MRKKISQNEAHSLKARNKYLAKKVEDLEWEIRRFRSNYSAGRDISRMKDAPTGIVWSVLTANRLGHVVLATNSGDDLVFRALPLTSEAAS
jgi:hypothetical protein